MKPLVYIAGPYTHPDPVANTRKMLKIATQLVEDGRVTPIVPHLTMFWHLVTPRPIEFWYAYDRDVLARCDIVLRVAGASKGAAEEVTEAKRLGLLVAYDLESLWAHVEKLVEYVEGR